jgi:L-ascorbate metabolism protein UlaG (beta-lactamase superfamily)
MKRRNFLQALTLLASSPYSLENTPKTMKQNSIQLIRHATLILNINNLKLLIDPMLSAKSALDPVQNSGNDIRFPMVELPFSPAEFLNEIDAIFVTHLHRDHWDIAAQQLINKDKQIFCQPGDEQKIKEQGFKNVTSIESGTEWNKIKISRTGGQHGTGVFSFGNETIYVAGDTVWCEEVKTALDKFKPNITVLNAGGAKFLTGDPITMTPDDIIKVHETLPQTRIIAVHMDTVNHCFIKRADLKTALAGKNANFKISIPNDGEVIS